MSFCKNNEGFKQKKELLHSRIYFIHLYSNEEIENIKYSFLQVRIFLYLMSVEKNLNERILSGYQWIFLNEKSSSFLKNILKGSDNSFFEYNN